MAWLFNIRGSDILYNPVAFAASLLTQEDALLFIDAVKLGEGVEQVRGWTILVCPCGMPDPVHSSSKRILSFAWQQQP